MSINRKDLLAAVKRVLPAVAKRPALPILTGVMVSANGEVLTLSAFDYETAITTTVPCNDHIPATLVEASKLHDVLNKAKADYVRLFDNTAGKLRVDAGPVTFDLVTMDSEKYPNLPADEARPIRFTSTQVADWAYALVSAGTDKTMPVLTGVLFENTDQGVMVASTDRFRLHLLRQSPVVSAGTPDGKALIPREVVSIVVKMFKGVGVTYGVQKRETFEPWVSFSDGTTTITARTLSGDFPQVLRLIPSEFTDTIAFSAKEALEVLGQVDVMLERNCPVRLTVNGSLRMSSGVGDESSASGVVTAITPNPSPEDRTIALNPKYLADALKALPLDSRGTDTVTLSIPEGYRPVTFTVDGRDDMVSLIMPVRL